jgi:hypothetical protein
VVNAECEKPSNKVKIDIATTIVLRYSASFFSSLPVSLDCHLLIVPSVFSNVYLEKMTVSVLVSDYFCESDKYKTVHYQIWPS